MRRFFLVGIFLVSILAAFGQNPKWRAWEAQADTLATHEEFAKAIKLYTKIIKASKLKSKDDFGVLYKRALSYYSTQDFAKAIQDLNTFVEAIPQFPQARILRALINREVGNSEAVLADLDQVLATPPGNPALLKWRASVHLEEDHFELARKDADMARMMEDDAEVETYLAVALYNLGDTDSALVCIDKAMALEATYLPAYLYGGSFCLEQERYEKAVKYLDFALRLDPKNVTAIFYKGVALIELEKTDEGCRCLRKSFNMGMDDASEYLTEYCFGVEN